MREDGQWKKIIGNASRPYHITIGKSKKLWRSWQNIRKSWRKREREGRSLEDVHCLKTIANISIDKMPREHTVIRWIGRRNGYGKDGE